MDIGYSVDFLVFHQISNLLDNPGTINQIGKFLHHNPVFSVCHGFNFANGAHLHFSSSGTVCLFHIPFSENGCAGWKIGSLHNGKKLLNFRLSSFNTIVNNFIHAGNDFPKIMRRDIGGHADRNTGCTVYKEVRKTCRKDRRLIILIRKVRHEINCILVDSGKHLCCHFGHLCLGITHCGGTVSIFRTEISLLINQDIAHGPWLSHVYKRTVDGRISVRMILTHRLSYDGGTLLCLLIRCYAKCL